MFEQFKSIYQPLFVRLSNLYKLTQVHKFISHNNIPAYTHFDYGVWCTSIDRNADLLLLAYELVQNFYNYLFHLTAIVNIFYEGHTKRSITTY